MAKYKSAVTTAFEIERIKASEIQEGKYLFVGSFDEAEAYVKANKPAAENQGEQSGEVKVETVADIFNVSPDETRTTQESTYQPVKAVKAWGAKNRNK